MTEPAGRRAAQDEDLAKLTGLIADIQICMLTTRTAEGVLMSRPMAVQEVEFNGEVRSASLSRTEPMRTN